MLAEILDWRSFVATCSLNNCAQAFASRRLLMVIACLDEVTIHASLLAPDDIVDMNKRNGDKARKQFCAGRIVLRMALSLILGSQGREVRVQAVAGQKPKLPTHLGLDFSLSYSGDYLMLALSRGGLVGGDIEGLKEIAEWPDLIRKWPKARQREIAVAPDPSRAFLHDWTQREAVLKTFGRGISELSKLDALEFPRCNHVDHVDEKAPLKTPWGRVVLWHNETKGLAVSICQTHGT